MAEDDKGRGPDLRKELNSLWKSTIDQFDELKDVVVRSSNAGKAKLDATFLKRQRDKLLAEIGERLLEVATESGTPLPEDVEKKVQRLEELKAEIEDNEGEVDRLLRPDEEDEAAAGSDGATAADDEPEEKAQTKAHTKAQTKAAQKKADKSDAADG